MLENHERYPQVTEVMTMEGQERSGNRVRASRGAQNRFANVDQVIAAYREAGYVCDTPIATTLYVARHLGKPILVEGPAGVGKTELAKATAAVLSIPLIRLQCYEGLDESKALYEWKYGKQLLYTQVLKERLDELIGNAASLADAVSSLHDHADLFFSSQFLEPRPLLRALQQESGAVLLVDEIDKADEEFEAFQLEILSDFQVSIPELGTIRADTRPFVILTSNKVRGLGEALKRRCLHLYIPYPSPRRELEILHVHVPDGKLRLKRQLVSFVQQVRNLELKKAPSVSETIDWAKAVLLLHAGELDRDLLRSTLNVLLKHERDIARAAPVLDQWIRRVHDRAEP